MVDGAILEAPLAKDHKFSSVYHKDAGNVIYSLSFFDDLTPQGKRRKTSLTHSHKLARMPAM